MNLTTSLAAAGLAATIAAPAMAHHATAPHYDFDNTVTIEGRVTSVFWRNPHVRLTLDVIGDGGNLEVWDVEAGSVNALERLGYGPDTLAVGAHVVLTGGSSRLGLNTMAVVIAELDDGAQVPLWPQRAAALGFRAEKAEIAQSAVEDSARRADGIFRVWTRVGGYRRVTPYSDEAIAAREQWDLLTDDPALDCLPPGMPGMMNNPYPIEFVDRGETIDLRLEEWDARRVIHLNDGREAAARPATRFGDSTGRWEGRTLVVTTTRIDYPYHDDTGTPQSDAAEIVERFTLSDDESSLEYNAVITDPTYLTEPAVWNGRYTWVAGEEIKQYACTLREQ